MKKPAAVIEAEAMVKHQADELSSARELVKTLERQYYESVNAVHAAQEHADADLPQCRLVHIAWRGNQDGDGARCVILRKTPTGMLVVRHVGAASGHEYRFKWDKHNGRFVEAKASSWLSGHSELRDVPSEYMPEQTASGS